MRIEQNGFINNTLEEPSFPLLARMLLSIQMMQKSVPIFAIIFVLLALPAYAEFTPVDKEVTVSDRDPRSGTNQDFSYQHGPNGQDGEGGDMNSNLNPQRQNWYMDPNIQKYYEGGFNQGGTGNYNTGYGYGGYGSSGGSSGTGWITDTAFDLFGLFTSDNFGRSFWELFRDDLLQRTLGTVLGGAASGANLETMLQQMALSGMNAGTNPYNYNCPGGNCSSTYQNPYGNGRNMATDQGYQNFSTQIDANTHEGTGVGRGTKLGPGPR